MTASTTAPQDAEAVATRPEEPYIVLTDAVNLRLDNQTGPNGELLKYKAQRVQRGEVVYLWPEDEQTKTMLSLLAIAPYVPGREYPRPTIAQIAAAQGAVDTVATRAIRAGLNLEAAPNEPAGNQATVADDLTPADYGTDSNPYDDGSAFATDDDDE